MNVWIDGLAFETFRQRGVWRVFYEMIDRTKDRVDYTIWLQSEPVQPIPEGVKIVRTEGRGSIKRWDVLKRWERRWLRTHDPEEMEHADLFHSTGYTWPHRKTLPSVITLCDMIAESHFAICPPQVQETLGVKREALQRASSLVCISDSTFEELRAFYPEFSSKASVIKLAVSTLSVERRDKGCHVGEKEFDLIAEAEKESAAKQTHTAVFLGQRAGYKNFDLILQAMASPHWPHEIDLTVVGDNFSFGEQLLIRRYRLSDRIRNVGTVGDSDLVQVLRNAHCLIFPSLQEGFGLPCLEAQAAGCPLVCSDIPVFREVAGEAAIYFDPRLHESLTTAVRCLDAREERDRLLKLGRVNIARFDWCASSNELVKLYEQLYNGTKHQ